MRISSRQPSEHERWRPPTATMSCTSDAAATGAVGSEPLPESVVQALATLNDEVTALRDRLTAVERALGLPAPRYGPAPPDLPALLRRVSELERRSGVVSSLAPLPGLDTPRSSVMAADAPTDRAGRAVWQGIVGAAVAVFLNRAGPLAVPRKRHPAQRDVPGRGLSGGRRGEWIG